jgi:hypothetical protein
LAVRKKHEESGATSDRKAVDGGGRHQRGGKATGRDADTRVQQEERGAAETQNGKPDEAWRAREAGRREGNSTRRWS